MMTARALLLGLSAFLLVAGPLSAQNTTPEAQAVVEISDTLLESLATATTFTLDNPQPALNTPERVEFRFEQLRIGSAGSIRFRAALVLHRLRTGVALGRRVIERVIDRIQATGRGRVVLRIEDRRLAPRLTLTRLDIAELPGEVVETGVRVFLNSRDRELLRPLDLPVTWPTDIPLYGLPLSPELVGIDSQEGTLKLGLHFGAGVFLPGAHALPECAFALGLRRDLVEKVQAAYNAHADFAELRREIRDVRLNVPEAGVVDVDALWTDRMRLGVRAQVAVRRGTIALGDVTLRDAEFFAPDLKRDPGLREETRRALADLSDREFSLPVVRVELPIEDVRARMARSENLPPLPPLTQRFFLQVRDYAAVFDPAFLMIGAQVELCDDTGAVLARLRRAG